MSCKYSISFQRERMFIFVKKGKTKLTIYFFPLLQHFDCACFFSPQFDAHFSNMTGKEHVELYASIKGIPRHLVKVVCKHKLTEVGISDHDSNLLSSTYSGGMKR